MDTPTGRKAISHERILASAARALRRGGFDGIGVADVMKDAGLTHGGFYAHFASRDALLAAALERAGQDSAARIAQAVTSRSARGASPLRALVDGYLSAAHLTSADKGCPVAALASEIPRQTSVVRQAAVQRVRGLLDRVEAALPPGAPAGSAAAVASQLVGALQLARALGDTPAARDLLAANRRVLLAHYDTPT